MEESLLQNGQTLSWQICLHLAHIQPTPVCGPCCGLRLGRMGPLGSGTLCGGGALPGPISGMPNSLAKLPAGVKPPMAAVLAGSRPG